MKPSPEADLDYLDLIIEIVGHIKRRLGGLTLDQFANDKDEVDLTAFRISAIGETTRKLTEELKARHPELAWRSIYGMRNAIAHGYERMDPTQIWNAAVNSLDALVAVCEIELERAEGPTSPPPDRR
jgi:uncharacterized protein with HEPN domain